MPTGKQLRYYSGEFKQQVVETMQREKLSCHEAARRFGVPQHKIVARWERHYLQQGISGPCLEHRVPDWSEYAMPRPPHPEFESASTIQSS